MADARSIEVAAADPNDMPAEPGMWIIIFGDLIIFGLFFLVYLYYFRAQPEIYALGQSSLDRRIGVANTIALLTSSLFVALAVRRGIRSAKARRRDLDLGILFGLAFVVLKGIEWSAKFRHGIDIATDEFFMFYFTLGGVHLAHVVIGLIVLCVARRALVKLEDGGGSLLVECGALFWHMVDVLWVLLFALLYLLRP